MGLENDPYRDEDGEPLMDADEMQSDGEDSPLPGGRFDDDDDDEEEDWQTGPSEAPAFDEDKVGKPRKRLVKKSGKESPPPRRGSPEPGLDDWIDDEVEEEEEEEEEAVPSSSKAKKRKASSIKEGKEGGGKDKRRTPSKAAKVSKSSSKGFGGGSGDPDDVEEEMRELWNTVVGQDSENDEEVVRTADDDAFIDDTGVDHANRYGSDNEADFAGNAPQAEEGEEDDDEVSKLFKGGKKKKKNEKSPAELAMIVERLMAELEVTAEEDAELNRQSKPAINKLKKLPMLTNVLSKKNLQQEFLDHGVLTLLKNWLEPLPDGSLPNMNVRTAVLQILSDLPIDLEQYDRREQLKKSGLGRVIMFLSKSDEETTSNRKLAKELVDKWSRPIFNKSTRYEDMRSFDNEKVPFRRPTMKKPVNKASGLESRDDDLDLGDFSQGTKSSQAAARRFTSRPEALPLDFLVRPQSKIDPEEIRARAKHVVQDQRRLKMNKKLQQLKAPKKKQLQASKPSVEGRGMVKYL